MKRKAADTVLALVKEEEDGVTLEEPVFRSRKSIRNVSKILGKKMKERLKVLKHKVTDDPPKMIR